MHGRHAYFVVLENGGYGVAIVAGQPVAAVVVAERMNGVVVFLSTAVFMPTS